jgi:hypothetical protein
MTNTTVKFARTATEALLMLWREGFLRTWQSQPKIVGHLAEIDHHFEGPELGMALRRARYLSRRGERGGYEYIQKYPHTEEDAAPAAQSGYKGGKRARKDR